MSSLGGPTLKKNKIQFYLTHKVDTEGEIVTSTLTKYGTPVLKLSTVKQKISAKNLTLLHYSKII